MTLPRAFGLLLLALAFAAPRAAGAQTVPAGAADALAAQTNAYFHAVAKADAATLIDTTSKTYHVITPDGKRLNWDDYFARISSVAFMAQPPMGMNVKIKSTTLTATGATQSVDTLQWYYGGLSNNPRMSTVLARDTAYHELTWTKTASGKWLLEEDHILQDYLD
jgi:hypothetical protein